MRTTPILIAALLLAAGCGEDKPEPKPAAPAAAAPAASAALPAELVGTWKVTIKRSEIPDPPNEFNEAAPGWKLEFRADGGIDDAPSATVSNDAIGSVWSLQPAATGDQITLADPQEDCEHRVGYTLEGERLTLQPPDVRGCTDPLLEAMLTMKPWRRG